MSVVGQDRETLLHEHEPWLRRVISARVPDSASQDDVLAEVGLAILKSPSPLPSREEIRPWLCRIAIRQAALHVRKVSRYQRTREAFQNESPPKPPVDPLLGLLHQERTDLIRSALASLSPQQQQLLRAKYFECRTYRDLAAQRGVPPHVIEYEIVSAKKAFRAAAHHLGLNEEDHVD